MNLLYNISAPKPPCLFEISYTDQVLVTSPDKSLTLWTALITSINEVPPLHDSPLAITGQMSYLSWSILSQVKLLILYVYELYIH